METSSYCSTPRLRRRGELARNRRATRLKGETREMAVDRRFTLPTAAKGGGHLPSRGGKGLGGDPYSRQEGVDLYSRRQRKK